MTLTLTLTVTLTLTLTLTVTLTRTRTLTLSRPLQRAAPGLGPERDMESLELGLGGGYRVCYGVWAAPGLVLLTPTIYNLTH